MNKILPVFLLVLAPLALAQSPKKLEIFHRDVYVIEPNMELVLALTDEQQSKIESEFESWKSDPEVKTAKESADSDPSMKTAFYRAAEAAQNEYLAKVSEILDEKQNALVESANAFALRIATDNKSEIDVIMKGLKSGETKWGDKLDILRKQGQERIGEILTPGQIAIIRPDGTENPTSEPAAE